ncbi:hypothetical protein PoB_004905800 [Plakobranchus ocellatus]|uniref:Uncharacterized protein n=1 Tax=Plakobranchus ocellatus TaxID=259542 RepID=A0AAV4BSG8_9GAST|nr:hypothetical protein PoB_004905800 [Plakobranchus ocellatus]
MEALKVRIDDLEKQVQAQEQKLEAQKNCSFLELQVSTSVDSLMNRVLRLNRKLDSLKLNMQVRDSETRESLKDLSEISKENVNALKGLRKFQNLLQQKTQASISRPLKEAR